MVRVCVDGQKFIRKWPKKREYHIINICFRCHFTDTVTDVSHHLSVATVTSMIFGSNGWLVFYFHRLYFTLSKSSLLEPPIILVCAIVISFHHLLFVPRAIICSFIIEKKFSRAWDIYKYRTFFSLSLSPSQIINDFWIKALLVYQCPGFISLSRSVFPITFTWNDFSQWICDETHKRAREPEEKTRAHIIFSVQTCIKPIYKFAWIIQKHFSSWSMLVGIRNPYQFQFHRICQIFDALAWVNHSFSHLPTSDANSTLATFIQYSTHLSASFASP